MIASPNLPENVSHATKRFLQEGRVGDGMPQTAGCCKTYEELKANDVEFMRPPEQRFCGVEALIKDNSVNWFSLTEAKGF